MKYTVSVCALALLLCGDIFGQDLSLFEKSAEEQRVIDLFGEKLVDLAIQNHPDIAIAEKNSAIAKKRETVAKFGWLGNISAGGNINELSINPPPEDVAGNIFFPRYNFGVVLPLSLFVSQPNETKIAKAEYSIRIDEKKKAELQIRKDVLIAYNNYLLRKDLYDMQVSTVEEEQAIVQSTENQFAGGEISLEEYNAANRKYKAEVEKLLNFRTNLNNSKLEIEQFIGTDLDSVR